MNYLCCLKYFLTENDTLATDPAIFTGIDFPKGIKLQGAESISPEKGAIIVAFTPLAAR